MGALTTQTTARLVAALAWAEHTLERTADAAVMYGGPDAAALARVARAAESVYAIAAELDRRAALEYDRAEAA